MARLVSILLINTWTDAYFRGYLQVNLYSAESGEHLVGYQLTSSGSARHMTGVKFTCDGRRILAATNAKRMTVLDVDRAEQIQCFDNCAFNARERIPLATDPTCPHLAVCVCVNGKGLTLFDLRMPLPLDFVLDLHSSTIRDITFIDSSWPFVRSHQSALVSLSADGVCKVTTLDGRTLDCIEVGHPAYSIAVTPEPYKGKKASSSRSSRSNSSLVTSSQSNEEDDDWRFASLMMIGGQCMSRYRPDNACIERQEVLKGVKELWSARSGNNSKNTSAGPSPPTTPMVMESCPSTPTNSSNSFSCSNVCPVVRTTSSACHITRLRYTSSGGILYASTNTGVVKRFRRYPDGEHVFLGDVLEHKGPVYDMDISSYDEYLITASKDRHVGLVCLGAPNHGSTGRVDMT